MREKPRVGEGGGDCHNGGKKKKKNRTRGFKKAKKVRGKGLRQGGTFLEEGKSLSLGGGSAGRRQEYSSGGQRNRPGTEKRKKALKDESKGAGWSNNG